MIMMSRKLVRPHHQEEIGKPDLVMRMRYATEPATMEIVSRSQRGDDFLRRWVHDDKPATGPDGRLFVILLQSDVEKCLIDAARADLEF